MQTPMITNMSRRCLHEYKKTLDSKQFQSCKTVTM